MTKRTVEYVVETRFKGGRWHLDSIEYFLDNARYQVARNKRIYGDMGLHGVRIKRRVTETIVKERIVK